ncbi:MAG: ACP S-malonyltransferase [Phycisphaerales bacterium]|jgi:[acyl-carrier-protein] S-malonyltransferase|tara:strand:- start:7378 stop:8298 length:921 start_codon:yes stop_codon:yes gene_type:complete
MTDRLVVLCPGQGAQKAGMGKAWFDASPAAREIFEKADAFLGDSLGLPLSEICFSDPNGEINKTNISQPAIYTCSIASWQGLREQGLSGDLVATAGLSLGEYTALHLAGVFTFEEGLELVATRGRLMQEAAEAEASTMVAVIGDDEIALQLCEEAKEGDEILVAANFNAPGQTVLSGSISACTRVAEMAEEKGVRATVLSVAGAFHSPFMAPAAGGMQEALAKATLNAPKIDVWSNVTAELHTLEQMQECLVTQITGSVRWAQSCGAMATRYDGCSWHELAPSGVLRGLMRRVNRDVKVLPHDEPK